MKGPSDWRVGTTIVLLWCTTAGSPGWAGGAAGTATPAVPASIEKLYPPQAGAPAFLFAMVGMATIFSGMVGDVMEGDQANAEKGFADFLSQYGKIGQMVPEWSSMLPMEPVEALGAAIRSQDPSRVMPAVEGVAQVCHSCHAQSMAAVQQKFHWGDFRGIAAADPVSSSSVPFQVLMQMLDGDLAGVQVDLAQGQLENARGHARALASRFVALAETCGACHDSPRHYYVDATVTGMIEKLIAALEAPAVDPQAVGGLIQGIGMESCHKCHLVHGPAALAQHGGASTK